MILMDISMPEMSGLDATAAIRSEGCVNADTHIIALTAHAVSGDQEKFLAARMSGYLCKPLRKERLLAALDAPAAGAANPDLVWAEAELLLDTITMTVSVFSRITSLAGLQKLAIQQGIAA